MQALVREDGGYQGYDLFAAKEVSLNGRRADGKEGNIFYAAEKAAQLLYAWWHRKTAVSA